MPYLRIITTSKKINNNKYIDELFSIDPDPRPRGNIVPDNWADGLPDGAGPELIEQRQHPLSWLPGGVGPKKSTVDNPIVYSNQLRATELFFVYGRTFSSLADQGKILLRYGKLNDDGRSVSTYIIFLQPAHWFEVLQPAFDNVRPYLSELFTVEESSRNITSSEYNSLVRSFNRDIAGMKTRNEGKCRLDFINAESL